MAVLFVNNGLLDIRALTTFGVSVKANESAIGYFGTGFKYALATCLREGLEVRVHAGNSIYKFKTVPESIRGETFDVIHMSVNNRKSKSIGITTQAGRNWNLFHAYREFYSNCIDERGFIEQRDNVPSMYPICIFVKGQLFEEVHKARNTIILDKQNKKLLFANSYVEIFEGNSSTIFYRGIAAKTINNPSLFTYNILAKMDLTEDRTFACEWTTKYLICNAVIQSDKEDIIMPAIIQARSYENQLEFDYLSIKPSDVFKGVVRQIRATATAQISNHALNLFYKNTDEINDVFNIVQLTEEQQRHFEKAKQLLMKAELIPNINKYEIIFVEKLASQSGEAFKGKIIINVDVCSANMYELLSTILEEYLHIEENVQDCTRKFQNVLFEIIARLVSRTTI